MSDEELKEVQDEIVVAAKKHNNVKHRHQTGGLQEKKIKIPPTKEELKVEQKQEKEKRREKAKERRKDRPNIFVRFWRGTCNVVGELKKVNWPTFQKAVAQTGVVLGFVAIFSLIVFAIDMGLGQLFDLLTRNL